jgi:hypothetical protein
MLRKEGLTVVEDYLSGEERRRLLASIETYATSHDLPLIVRQERERSLRYRVIDGDAIYTSLPELVTLYERVWELVKQETPQLELLPNRTASVNVNITPPGGEYRWHYDRNAVTAILFLNSVEGGETEMYPNFRLHLGRGKDSAAQRMLDSLLRLIRPLRRKVVVAPAPGRMIVMHGDRCLHSVRRVERGNRVNVVMTFDLPGSAFRAEQNLDPYLYSQTAPPEFDPNYRP